LLPAHQADTAMQEQCRTTLPKTASKQTSEIMHGIVCVATNAG
jgi:hypothetical protein